MWCLTELESAVRCASIKSLTLSHGHPERLQAKHIVSVPLYDLKWGRLAWFSKLLGTSLGPFDECLLWVAQWSVAGTSHENWHPFYRLRESYGERRPLHDAPGHLFLEHEAADLASFIGLALQYGWDFFLLPDNDYASVFVTHDGFLEFHSDDAELAGEFGSALDGAGLAHTEGTHPRRTPDRTSA